MKKNQFMISVLIFHLCSYFMKYETFLTICQILWICLNILLILLSFEFKFHINFIECFMNYQRYLINSLDSPFLSIISFVKLLDFLNFNNTTRSNFPFTIFKFSK